MKTELKEISPTRKQIDIEIDADAVPAVYDRISDNYAKMTTVPGFRPGHAPRGVIRTRFKDQIRTDVLRELLPNAVQEAIATRMEQVIFSYLHVDAAMHEVVGALEDRGLPPAAASNG